MHDEPSSSFALSLFLIQYLLCSAPSVTLPSSFPFFPPFALLASPLFVCPFCSSWWGKLLSDQGIQPRLCSSASPVCWWGSNQLQTCPAGTLHDGFVYYVAIKGLNPVVWLDVHLPLCAVRVWDTFPNLIIFSRPLLPPPPTPTPPLLLLWVIF